MVANHLLRKVLIISSGLNYCIEYFLVCLFLSWRGGYYGRNKLVLGFEIAPVIVGKVVFYCLKNVDYE